MSEHQIKHINGRVMESNIGFELESVPIDGRSPHGYPKFSFWYDDTANKFSVENTETKERTEPFIDDVYLSAKPLETWTADYVVVRIGKEYFLCDNNGNCFFKSDESYIICRNVFVSGDGSYIITEKLEKISAGEVTRFVIRESEGYKFAFYSDILFQNDTVEALEWIDCYGNIKRISFNYDEKLRFDSLHKWCVYHGSETSFFDKEFKLTFMGDNTELVGKKSTTYTTGYRYYSTYFHSLVGFKKYGNLEIVEHNGRTYFFKANGQIEEIEPSISGVLEVENYIIYRYENKIYWRDFDGVVFKEEELTSKELYICELIKMQLDSTNQQRRTY